MADEQEQQNSEYKLLRAIDPTKINVPISTKFAKLTLSSNKKKKQQKENEIDAAAAGDNQDKRQQEAQSNQVEPEKTASTVSRRNLMDSLCAVAVKANTSYENPLLRSTSSIDLQNADTQLNSTTDSVMTEDDNLEQRTQLIKSELNDLTMEPLQVSCEELNELSQRISHLTVENNVPASTHAPIKAEMSICISSDEDEESLCITISSESTVSDKNQEPFMLCTQPSLETVAIEVPELPKLSDEKVNRIHEFLRDVSMERHEMERRGKRESSPQLDVHKKLAAADTESMSQASILLPYEIAGNGCTETSSSKVNEKPSNENDEWRHMADDDTEVNTILSNSDDLVSNASTPIKHDSKQQNDSTLNESVTIPETSSDDDDVLNNSDNVDKERNEATHTKPRRKETISTVDSSSSETDEDDIHLNSINISAKINIKIQIPSIQSSSDTVSCSSNDYGSDPSNPNRRTLNSSDEPSPETTATTVKNYTRSAEKQSAKPKKRDKQLELQKTVTQDVHENEVDKEEEAEEEDENFLTHAEKLLNQLYGKSWQTPDVIRTLKRTSGSAKKKSPTAPAQEKLQSETIQMATRISHTTTNKSKVADESILADFSIFKRDIVNAKMDSTHLMTPSTRRRNQRTTTELASEPRLRTNRRQLQQQIPQTQIKKQMPKRSEHKHEDRWRQLLDSDSDSEGALASDDEELDATDMISDDDSSDSGKSEKTTKSNKNKRNEMVYLDLTKDEVVEQEEPTSPTSLPANNDDFFQKRLQDILRTCMPKEKPKLVATPQSDKKTKRKLFTPNLGYEDETEADELIKNVRAISDDLLGDLENVYLPGTPVHKRLQEIKKNIVINSGGTPQISKPIFKPPSEVTTTPTPKKSKSKGTITPSTTKTAKPTDTISKKTKACSRPQYNDEEQENYSRKYSFLKSLDACVDKAYCHSLALNYRECYRTKKEELAQYLYDLYNEKIFNNRLEVPLTWNKKLLNTAGRCLNKKRMGTRSSVIELSDKVLTSADRLRCTLLHELCHAATWIFNGEGGHGATWKSWAKRSNATFPELPKIGVCHQYEIEYKYTYKCTLCAAKSHAHSKSKKVENIRCAYCHGAIEIFLNKKDKDGNIIATPVRGATGFAKFVKDHYKRFKRPDLKHADVMKILSNEFSNLKTTNT